MVTHFCWSCGVWTQINQTSKMCQPCIDEWADAAAMAKAYDRKR